MKKHLSISIILVSLIIIGGCYPVTTTTTQKKTSRASTYNPFIYKLHPEYFVYHQKNTSSRLYTKLNLAELMFAPIGINRAYEGRVKIEYFIFKAEETNNIVDSTSVNIDIKKKKGQNNAVTYLNINDRGLNEYYLKIRTTDMLRRSSVEEFIYVNVKEESSCQNFLINQKTTNVPYFRNYFRTNQVFSITHNKSKNKVYVKYYKEPIPLPHPPFSSMQRQPLNTKYDSIWSIAGNDNFQFTQKLKGLFHIQTDTTNSTGLTLINSGDNFPYIKTSDNMIYPLQYLMSTAEFKEIIAKDNKKLAIDRFWLECGGNINRARELIRIFYNRTRYANVYFTSFTDGWRTDRGMIYLMFGPPKSVRKEPEKEIWIYSDKLNYRMLKFVFNRQPNPFTNNDFVLERNLDFKSFWFKSIESWRKGKVYTVFR